MSVQSTANTASAEQTTPVPATSSPTPKLRSSCNACGAAKVKCDRGRPKCGRCTVMSSPCIYGLSRNLGKPQRKRPGVNLEGSTEKRMRNTQNTSNCIRDAVVGSVESQNVHEPLHGDRSNFAGDFLPFSEGFNSVINSNEHLPSSAFYPAFPMEGWHPLGDLGMGLGIPSTFPFEPFGTPRASDDNPESHSCPRESYEIFRDLICPSPTLHAPESTSVIVSVQLDEVLHFNRSAITRLGGLLECPCAKSGHRAMVHASIVSRILIWYQQAAGLGSRPSASAVSSTPRCAPGSASASPSLPEVVDETATDTDAIVPPSLTQTTGFTVEPPSISIGTFSVEDLDVQAAFRNHLVLSELKKMIPLIDMFIFQNSGDSLVASLYSHLGAWLRTEHSRTVAVLRTRLSELNKALESQ
ncbi:Fusarubin cluster-specific transcription factor fsr6-like protein [Cladobotryum mycophilum]|uniref:Fusarubin cluster-specific transcription factor fsr6-like protein n=1 Tax=Cladobotryum mycophilum TaxID=491253 RepID=A0ABR0SPL7_9HYPO